MTSKERAFIVESIEIRMNFMPQTEEQIHTAASIVSSLRHEMRLANGLQIPRARSQKEMAKRSRDLMVPSLRKNVDWDNELKKLRGAK